MLHECINDASHKNNGSLASLLCGNIDNNYMVGTTTLRVKDIIIYGGA